VGVPIVVRMVTTARIDAIGLIASDLGRTVTFYRALGCDLPDPASLNSAKDDHLECDLGGVRLMFDTEEVMRSFSEDTWSGPGAGRLTLAARCDSPADVDRLHDELAGLGSGTQVAPFDAPWGMRYATVRDPDGVRVDLYAPLPTA
jgi:catechol 2,3-dioxygenase-like lactoylglutathione lyase family enzyme